MGSQRSTSITLDLSPEEWGMAETLATRWGVSVHDAIRRLLRDTYRAECGDDEPPATQPIVPGTAHEVHGLEEIRRALEEDQAAPQEPQPMSTREVPASELLRAAEAQMTGGPTRQVSAEELLATAERELQSPQSTPEDEASRREAR